MVILTSYKVSLHMNSNIYQVLVVFFALLFSLHLTAQSDCILGVGVVNDSVLIEIFQLNPKQSKELVNYSAEIKYRNEILDNKLANIRKRHPQSSVQELSNLATAYNVIMDSMHLVQAMVDKRLLTLFNQKQYSLYRNLCLEASRSPFIVAPTIYVDSVVVKKRSTFLNNLEDKN